MNAPDLTPHPIGPALVATEERLRHIWSRILGIRDLRVDDDLFDLGARPADMAWALVRVEEDLGVEVSMASIMTVHTVAQMADVVSLVADRGAAERNPIEVRSGDPSRPGLFLVHDGSGSTYPLRHLIDALGDDQPMAALESPYLNGEAVPFRDPAMLALRYITEVQLLQPEGPYRLLGASFGAIVAFEMARQLVASGHDVPFLAVIDVGPCSGGQRRRHRSRADRSLLRELAPGADVDRRERLRWLADLARRSPAAFAAHLSTRAGAARWLEPLVQRGELRSAGRVSAGRRAEYAWQHHVRLAHGYRWDKVTYSGPLTLVWAADSAAVDGSMGWRRVLTGPLEIIHVDVDHDRLLEPEGAEVLGPMLRDALDSS